MRKRQKQLKFIFYRNSQLNDIYVFIMGSTSFDCTNRHGLTPLQIVMS